MRTLPRYLGGAVLVTALIVGGVAVSVAQTGSADERAAADAIVVLGAAQYDGEPSAVFRARLDHAAELYREGVAPRILTVGGGRTGDRTTEGAAGADYLAADGIDRSVLLAVGTGDDTLASLRATDELLDDNGWRSVVVVTDPWHAARSAMMATDLGLSVQVSPVQQGPALDSDVRLPYLLRETLGVLYYRLTGGSSGAGTTVM